MSNERKIDRDELNVFIQKLKRYDRYRLSHSTIEKTTNWIFAINVGTLLWFLGSFDKFLLVNILPNKTLFLITVLFLGISTVLFTLVKGILYLRQIAIDKAIESIEGLPDRVDLNKDTKTENELDLMIERISDRSLKLWHEGHNTITFAYSLIKYGLFCYIIGLELLTTYIIIYIIKYL